MAKEEVAKEAASVTVQVLDKIVTAVGPAISKLADSLGTTSEKVMIILTKQAYADAVEGFATVIICAIVAFGWYKFATYWVDKMKNDSWDDQGWVPLIIFSVVTYVIATIIAGSSAISGIKRLINPEYYALKEVMSFISKFSG